MTFRLQRKLYPGSVELAAPEGEGVAITLAEPRQRRLLGNIERLTKQTIEIRTVPSVADLRIRRIEITITGPRVADGDRS